jgi:hypothetical protein
MSPLRTLLMSVALLGCVSAGTLKHDFGGQELDGLNSTSSTCGGNCPGGCSSCPCGTSTSAQSASTWCSKYSWNQVRFFSNQFMFLMIQTFVMTLSKAHCECIMNAESGANAHAMNQNTDGSFDVGLWQINGAEQFNFNCIVDLQS